MDWIITVWYKIRKYNITTGNETSQQDTLGNCFEADGMSTDDSNNQIQTEHWKCVRSGTGFIGIQF